MFLRVFQVLTDARRNLRKAVKLLTSYVGAIKAEASEIGPEQCVAEEMFALRLARQNDAELITAVPRQLTYPEDVS